jgi:parvulin-like peptidyl-prolyl isomerase
MLDKIMRIIRRVEVALLKFFLACGRGVALFYRRVRGFIVPRWNVIWRTALAALVILYVIGAVVFGIRLYKQKRFERIDLAASCIYPFPVAKAGRAIVFDHQLQQWVVASKKFASENDMQVPGDLPQKVIEELVNYALAGQEADQLHVKLTQKDINDEFNLSIEGIGSREQAVDFLKQMYGLSLEQFKRMITPMIIAEKVRDDKFVHVQARHILIKDQSKAQDILNKIRGGGNFEDLAKDNSEDQGSKDQGGLLAGGEYIYRDSGLVPEVEDALFKMKKGEVSDLVQSQYGFHILKVEDRQGEIDMTMADWFESLKKKYPVKTLI